MTYQLLSKRSLYFSVPVEIVTLQVKDNGQPYIAYVLVKKPLTAQLRKDIQDGASLKLENYGMVFCTIPGESISPQLDHHIMEKIRHKHLICSPG